MEERKKKVEETFNEMDAVELEAVVEQLLQDDSSLPHLEQALTNCGYTGFPVRTTVTLEYEIDEDGLPDIHNVTVDGRPAERLPSEGRGITAAWDIVSTESWGIWMELGEF